MIAQHDIRLVRLDQNEDPIRLAPHILAGLRPEIAVEAVDAAGKTVPVVMRRERLDLQIGPRRRHVQEATRRLCSASARISRSLGSGGLTSASKNAARSRSDSTSVSCSAIVRRAVSVSAVTQKSL